MKQDKLLTEIASVKESKMEEKSEAYHYLSQQTLLELPCFYSCLGDIEEKAYRA